MVVEDEVKMAALIRRGLKEQGLNVDVTGTGEDAIGMARASSYDAIVNSANAHGVRVQMTLSGPAPAWATGNHKYGVYKSSQSYVDGIWALRNRFQKAGA